MPCNTLCMARRNHQKMSKEMNALLNKERELHQEIHDDFNKITEKIHHDFEQIRKEKSKR